MITAKGKGSNKEPEIDFDTVCNGALLVRDGYDGRANRLFMVVRDRIPRATKDGETKNRPRIALVRLPDNIHPWGCLEASGENAVMQRVKNMRLLNTNTIVRLQN